MKSDQVYRLPEFGILSFYILIFLKNKVNLYMGNSYKNLVVLHHRFCSEKAESEIKPGGGREYGTGAVAIFFT
ncbi:hypothetical protein [Paenibacillus larvae]|uniref:hypothetical protein n=1 Tax=Paenibacillus larvae TaxID=1464 RepID=UPI00228265A0|nr:hypothetical protein [Paenibacillus larvae]MCY9751133.1 hypothetical protein [Paenibacillus larvae]MCY9773960.1 hypothetical protein [Paenibacillus larvae]